MKILFADWDTAKFCSYVAMQMSGVECVVATDIQTALDGLNPPPDLIITQPTILPQLAPISSTSKILLWGDPKQRELASGHTFIELPVNVDALVVVINKMLSKK